jgi:hypothetical protein
MYRSTLASDPFLPSLTLAAHPGGSVSHILAVGRHPKKRQAGELLFAGHDGLRRHNGLDPHHHIRPVREREWARQYGLRVLDPTPFDELHSAPFTPIRSCVPARHPQNIPGTTLTARVATDGQAITALSNLVDSGGNASATLTVPAGFGTIQAYAEYTVKP